ncbi:flavodoxin domain-containing protein [Aporhodopirellula aestuarii]|uniref:Flavodoxin domain-containing protein n=1 Tax=Aporhodopirellula aestuarii TaxID=2950107 RepID=A0ABT0TYM8_9BACT|nr:flavodoxin domain-containing protein [Aporhodopirellula aestuarii]MCM2369707.1 flavodoxin domain-containing protein [Aporhodopirellula aestuarii]
MRAVVIYATCEGQTERIAKRIALTLNEHGVAADTFDVTKTSVTELAIESYEAVVLGSPLHYGEHDRRVVWCIQENHHYLSKIPNAFFTVCLRILDERPDEQKTVDEAVSKLFSRINYTPSRRATFAGALRYSEYGWLKKHMMRWIAKKYGCDTRLNDDHEFTDWKAVEDFATEFAELVKHTLRPDLPGRWNPDANRRPWGRVTGQSKVSELQ